MRHRPAISTTAFSAFIGLPFLVPAAALEVQKIPISFSSEFVLALLFIGIFPTVIGIVSWNAGVRRLGPTGAMVFQNTLPFYRVLMRYLFLDEDILRAHLLGGILIVGGGLTATQGRF